MLAGTPRIVGDTTGGGGGGGVVIGQPVTGGTPNRFLLIDGSGNVYDDVRVSYTSSTGLMEMYRDISVDVVQSLVIDNGLLGAISFTGSRTIDSNLGTSAYVGVADTSPFGGDSTTALMVATDSLGKFQNVILSPTSYQANITDGTIDALIKSDISGISIRYGDGVTIRRGIEIDSAGVGIYDSGSVNWYLPVGGNPGDVITRGPGDTATWSPSGGGGGSPGGPDKSVQINDAGNFNGYGSLTYDSAGSVLSILNAATSDTSFLFDSANDYYQLGRSTGMTPSQNPNMFFRQDQNAGTWTFHGARGANDTPISFTGTGLDDLTFEGSFNGSTPPNTYTATIDSVDSQIIEAPLTAGPGFAVGDTVEVYQGGPSGTLLGTGTVISSGGYPTIASLIVDFGGASAYPSLDYVVAIAGTGAGSESNTAIWQFMTDTVTFETVNGIGATSTIYAYPCLTYLFYASDGIGIVCQSMTGHTLGDEWTQTFDFAYGNMLSMNRISRNFILGNPTFGNRTSIDGNDALGRLRLFGDQVIVGKTGASNGHMEVSSSSIVALNDNLFEFTTTQAAGQNPWLSINPSTGDYAIGNINNGTSTGSSIVGNDTNGLLTLKASLSTFIQDNNGNNWGNINPAGSTVSFGNLSAPTGQTLTVNDSDKSVQISGNGTSETTYLNTITTTDATPTTIGTVAIPSSTTVMIEARVTARRTGGTSGTAEDGASYIVVATYKNITGTATEIGESSIYSAEDQAGWAVSVSPSSGNALIQVTGAVDNNISWVVTYRIYSVST